MTVADDTPSHVHCAIIGAGFAGIGTALRLQDSGTDDFVVLERASAVGGTWRDNRYPGVACDVPSDLYKFSWLPRHQFSRRFAPGPEIHRYLEQAAVPIGDRLILNTSLHDARWTGSYWVLGTSAGQLTADFLILACGRLTTPRHPRVPGEFAGPIFHSANWDNSAELTDKRVAVIGTGASAVQLVPHIADVARSVLIFQRSAPYVLPKNDGPADLPRPWHEAFFEADALHEFRVGTQRHHDKERALSYLQEQVTEPLLRAALTPDYEFGCKRVLFSDHYYAALRRPNVHVTGPLARYNPQSLDDSDGREHPIDVVILATGFHTAEQPYARRVRGRGGVSLAECWADGMQAYASTTIHGFPNLFVLDGPNTTLPHNSATAMIETQINYLLGALDYGPNPLEVSAEAQANYAAEIASRSADAPWMSGCSNWYIDYRSGRQVLLWPGRAQEFRERFNTFNPEPYLSPTPAHVS